MNTSIGTLRFAPDEAAERAAIVAKRYDREADHWDTTLDRLGFCSRYRELLATHHLGVQPGQSVRALDVGAGTGETALALAEALLGQGASAVDTTAVDLSAAMLAHAERKFHRASLQLRGQVANIESLPFPDESFDFVISAHVVEHTERPLRALAELERVLAPGGTLILMMTRCHPFTLGIQRNWTVQCARSHKLDAVLHDFGFRELRRPSYPRSLTCNLLSFCTIARKEGGNDDTHSGIARRGAGTHGDFHDDVR